MEKAPWPITSWEEGMMSTILGLFSPYLSLFNENDPSPFSQGVQFFSLRSSLRFLSHWLSWGNFVGRRRVFSGQGAVFLFSSFAKLLLICSKTQNLWPTTKSLIAHVFSSVSWGYHRWGYGFGLVSVGTGGPSYDVEALATIVRQGDEIIPLNIGPLVRYRSINFSFHNRWFVQRPKDICL